MGGADGQNFRMQGACQRARPRSRRCGPLKRRSTSRREQRADPRRSLRIQAPAHGYRDATDRVANVRTVASRHTR